MKKRQDFLGNNPEIGDIIVFNPPGYKGLVKGIIIGFQKSGLPQVGFIEGGGNTIESELKRVGFYVPKTGFIVSKNVSL